MGSRKLLTSRRRKNAVRAGLAFAIRSDAAGAPEALTLFVGRRALTRELSPEMVSMLVEALTRGGRSS